MNIVLQLIILIALSSMMIDIVHSLSTVTDTRKFFASTTRGIEKFLAIELQSLNDVSDVKVGKAGVSFTGTAVTGFEAVVKCRTALKIMEQVTEGRDIDTR